MKTIGKIHITPKEIVLNDRKLEVEGVGGELLKDAYRRYVGDYPKFFKMDALCRLGFVASELLLMDEGDRKEEPRSDRAIIFFNEHSSKAIDEKYAQTIQDKENYFPSPAAFVYTLPNIVTGEIAIRNHYQGETCFYVLEHRDDEIIRKVVEETLVDETINSCLCGWLDSTNSEEFLADLSLIEK